MKPIENCDEIMSCAISEIYHEVFKRLHGHVDDTILKDITKYFVRSSRSYECDMPFVLEEKGRLVGICEACGKEVEKSNVNGYCANCQDFINDEYDCCSECGRNIENLKYNGLCSDCYDD